MAKGIVKYRTGEDLEPIAQAITSMGQVASKEDKTIGLAEKVKKISTDATATPTQILSGQTAYVNGEKITGTMPNRGANNIVLPVNGTATIPEGYHNGQGRVTQNLPVKGAQNYMPGTTNQTIWGGQYLSGNQTILGDPNLISQNIVYGKTIFGVKGSFVKPETPLYYLRDGTPVSALGNLRPISNIPYIPVSFPSVNGQMSVPPNKGNQNFMVFSNPVDVTFYDYLTFQNGSTSGFSKTVLCGLISATAVSNASEYNIAKRVINESTGWSSVCDGINTEGALNTANIKSLSGFYYIAFGIPDNTFGHWWYIKNIYLSY